MLFLCVIQNLNTIWIAVLDYLDATHYHKNHAEAQAIMDTICIFFFFGTSNLMYWLFGFKYWVISIEVPRLISASKEGNEAGHKSICSETRYEALNWVGIIINMAVCMLAAWKRGIMEY